jgi:putative hemolysin
METSKKAVKDEGKYFWLLPSIKIFKPEKKTPKSIFEHIRTFAPHIRINIENRKYLIKTAEDGNDLEKVLRLRHMVYYEEILHRQAPNSIDMDHFDLICDHLMVIDKEEDTCVGTYRLNSSLFTDTFYSSTEFNIHNILDLNGTKLELGRVCIAQGYRNTLSIAMLWKGMIEYVKKTNTRFIFGCSSIKTTDLTEVIPVYLHIRAKHFCDESCMVYPRRKFRYRNFQQYIDQYTGPHYTEQKPDFPDRCFSSLLKFYLRCGAVVCGEPALDRDFLCTDFFTLLDITRIDRQVERKFLTG